MQGYFLLCRRILTEHIFQLGERRKIVLFGKPLRRGVKYYKYEKQKHRRPRREQRGHSRYSYLLSECIHSDGSQHHKHGKHRYKRSRSLEGLDFFAEGIYVFAVEKALLTCIVEIAPGLGGSFLKLVRTGLLRPPVGQQRDRTTQ